MIGFNTLPSIPPWIGSVAPLTCPDTRPLESTTTSCVTSETLAIFPSGVVCSARRCSPFSTASSAIAVCTHPGATAFALPLGCTRAISFFSDSKKPPCSADLDAA